MGNFCWPPAGTFSGHQRGLSHGHGQQVGAFTTHDRISCNCARPHSFNGSKGVEVAPGQSFGRRPPGRPVRFHATFAGPSDLGCPPERGPRQGMVSTSPARPQPRTRPHMRAVTTRLSRSVPWLWDLGQQVLGTPYLGGVPQPPIQMHHGATRASSDVTAQNDSRSSASCSGRRSACSRVVTQLHRTITP